MGGFFIMINRGPSLMADGYGFNPPNYPNQEVESIYYNEFDLKKFESDFAEGIEIGKTYKIPIKDIKPTQVDDGIRYTSNTPASATVDRYGQINLVDGHHRYYFALNNGEMYLLIKIIDTFEF